MEERLWKALGLVGVIRDSLTWLWRQAIICKWKRTKTWPIEIKPVGKPITATYDPGPKWLKVDINVRLRVRERMPESKMDDISLKLVIGDSLWIGTEYVPTWLSPKIVELKNKKLAEIPDGEYTITFTIPLINDSLGEWYKGGIDTDVYGNIEIKVGKCVCEAQLGRILRWPASSS